LAETPDVVPLTDEMRAELDRRLSSYDRDRSSAKPWDWIKDEFFSGK